MKVSCDVIKDLLLLYENGEASEATKKLVEEHLECCPSCQTLLSCTEIDELKEDAMTEIEKEEVKAVQKGLGKIKRRWKLSLTSALMIIPLFLVGLMMFHECTGRGVAFSNIDEIRNAKKFMRFIESGDFEKAAAMLDYSNDYESVVEVIENVKLPALIELYGTDPTMEEYKAARTDTLLVYLEGFKESGYSISNIEYNYVYASDHVYGTESNEERQWQVQIRFVEHGPDGFKQNVIAEFTCADGKISFDHAKEDLRLSAFEYAMNFNHLWNLEEIPSYEEYLEMEKAVWIYEE